MSRSFLRLTLPSLGFLVLTVLLVRGQATSPGTTVPSGITGRSTVDMTIEQAVALALQKNFDIKIQQISVENAKESITVAKADYDPNLTASTGHNLSQTSAATTLEGAAVPRNEGATGSVGVSQKLSTGANVSVSANLFNRTQSNQSIKLFNPQVQSGLSLSVNQPLLRGFGRSYNLANIKIAVIGLDVANLNYKGLVLNTIQSIENAYANLVSAREALEVRQFSLKLATTSDDETKARKNAGMLTDLDVFNSEYNVATSQNSVLQAEQSVRTSEDSLRTLLGGENFDISIIPVSGIPASTTTPPSVEDAYRLTLQNQTDYQARLASLQQTELNVQTAKSNRLPSLSATGTLGYTGNDRDIDSAWEKVKERDSYNWTLGLTFSMPWGLHAENARYRTALNNLLSAKLTIQQLEQSLLAQVRSAVRTVAFNIESVRLTALASDLSQKKYDAEKARYDVGNSTARNLLQAQSDLESARLSELQAKISLNNALTALQRLEGLTLDRYHITVPGMVQ